MATNSDAASRWATTDGGLDVNAEVIRLWIAADWCSFFELVFFGWNLTGWTRSRITCYTFWRLSGLSMADSHSNANEEQLHDLNDVQATTDDRIDTLWPPQSAETTLSGNGSAFNPDGNYAEWQRPVDISDYDMEMNNAPSSDLYQHWPRHIGPDLQAYNFHTRDTFVQPNGISVGSQAALDQEHTHELNMSPPHPRLGVASEGPWAPENARNPQGFYMSAQYQPDMQMFQQHGNVNSEHAFERNQHQNHQDHHSQYQADQDQPNEDQHTGNVLPGTNAAVHLPVDKARRTPKGVISCSNCSHSCQSARDMNRHLLAQHDIGVAEKHPCQTCGTVFGRSDNLKRHRETTKRCGRDSTK